MERKRKRAEKNSREAFLQEYSFEVTVVIMFLLGIFLLVEKMEISETLFFISKTILFFFADAIKAFRDLLVNILGSVEVSDLVGLVLILFAIFLIAIRWRHRMLINYQKLTECPDCDNKLKRVPKRIKHRFVGYIFRFRVYFYQCDNCYKKYLTILQKSRGK